MRVINIVDYVAPINAGIWKAAISTAEELQSKYGVASEIWYPANNGKKENFGVATPVALPDTQLSTLESLIKERKLNPAEDIIVSHGTWQYPTHWAHRLKRKGFVWQYIPHGMLEPWSMSQKKWKKLIYYYLVEKRYANRSDMVRAVGFPELKNLEKVFKRTMLIPNGVPITEIKHHTKDKDKTLVLFMGRLHHKKCVVPLAQAWAQSELAHLDNFELYIAGPDEGELAALQEIISTQKNIVYTGPVFGEAKERLLSRCHYFALPSFSEGFPTSVVESMQYGMLPLISEGCNFPEATQEKLALPVTTEVENITQVLNSLLNISEIQRAETAQRGQEFILKNYSLRRIAEQQYQLYQSLLQKRK